LKSFSHWRQSGVVNGSKSMQRETWFRLNCIVTRKENEAALVKSLKGRQLGSPHDLPELQLPSELYLGEYPWHPSLDQLGGWLEADSWRKLPVETKPAVIDFDHSGSGYDYSMERSVSVAMPAPWLADALSLRLSNGRQLTFVNDAGRTMFFDPSVSEPGSQAALVDREAFLAALEKRQLAAVWVIAGEKSVFGAKGPGKGWGGRLLHTNVYQFVKGQLICHEYRGNEFPSREQLDALLAEGSR
jgi:hypothetical protein